MESPNPKIALYGGPNECVRTNALTLLLSEVTAGVVALSKNLEGTLRKPAKILQYKQEI